MCWYHTVPNLGFPGVVVGLDEDLSQTDVFTNGHESLLHGLSRSQDGNTGDLRRPRAAKAEPSVGTRTRL